MLASGKNSSFTKTVSARIARERPEVVSALPELSGLLDEPSMRALNRRVEVEGEAVADVAHENGLAVHMDGARLMNAVVARGESARRFAAPCDSVWLDFTKGLGAPMGAVLAGSRDYIERARRYKHVFGGAMRQAGMIAAGCIYALEHNVERLREDHVHAQRLAEGLNDIEGVHVTNRVDTNIVYFDTTGTGMEAAVFQAAMMEQGVSFSQIDGLLRAATHLDVSADDIEQAVMTARAVLKQGRV